MYKLDLHYGYTDSEFGVCLTFQPADPMVELEHDVTEGLANRLGTTCDDDLFHSDCAFIKLPETLVARIKADAVKEHLAVQRETTLCKHISEVVTGDVIEYSGELYTSTSSAYLTDTDIGKEWNVDVESESGESYLYASYFPNGMVFITVTE